MEYWLESVVVGEDYKIAELILIKVNNSITETGDVFKDVKEVRMSKEKLIRMFNQDSSMFRNIKAITDDTIVVVRKAYNIFELLDIATASLIDNNEGYLHQYPGAILIHKGARKNSRVNDAELAKKLVTYMNKLKMLGTADNYDIDLERLTLFNIKNLNVEHIMPPVRYVNYMGSSGVTYEKVKTLIFSKETTDIKFPFHTCRNIRNIKFGKWTEKINGLHMLNNIDTLDLGGAYNVPSLSNKVSIDNMIVSTRCKIHQCNNCSVYDDRVDIKQITIKEFKEMEG